MKTIFNIVLVVFFLLKYATSQTLVEHQQIWLVQPGNISPSSFENFISMANASEGMAKISSISLSPPTVSFSATDFWPKGTWLHGYLERGTFWIDGFGTGCPQSNYGYPSDHPLYRINDKMIRSLIHANHRFPQETWVPNNIQSIIAGMDYMISHQWLLSLPPEFMDSYGGFTWWATRSSASAIDNESPYSNRPHAYETSHALRAMCEAYMYFRDNGIAYSNMTGLYDAIVKAANNLSLKNELTACDLENSNFKGLALWALAAAYKVTQDEKY